MKKRKISISRLIPFLSLCLCGTPLYATGSGMDKTAGRVAETSFLVPEQVKDQVRGIVVDGKTQEPIIGATAMIKDTSIGVTTNIDGEFVLDCKPGDIVVINYLGYQTKELKITNLKLYTVELDEATEMLGEVVVTAFGVGQKKESMVGAVTQIKPDELKVPSASLSSSFAGRLAGVIAVQRSGEPGADGASFWIRGKSTFSGATGALIILDGVEISSTELNSLDAEAIESFSILKDATATALYGTRGANGVMIITTKSGKDYDKPVINFRMEGALTSLTKVPEMADGVTYMEAYNEAASRPTSPATPYSEEKIANTRAGLNPYLYPNVDWYDEMFKKNAFAQRANFNIRGGNKKMDYFMSVGIKHSDGNLKSLSKKYGFSYDNNINVTNYDFINNLNVQATPTTKLSLGLNASVKDWKGPNAGTATLFASTMEHNPVDYPVVFPAGYGYDTEDIMWGDKSGGPFGTGGYLNPVADYVTGYKTNHTSIITVNFKLQQDLSMFLKGLTFNGIFSYKNNSSSTATRVSDYNAFEIASKDDATGEYTLRRTGKERGTAINTKGSHSGNRKLYLQATLDYKQIFNKVHDVNVMFLFNRQQYNNNNVTDLFSSLPERKQGIAGRVSYAYDGRYMAEANFGYNGSENFASGNRYGFFPSIAVGYNISNEKFWDNIRPVISNLKLRGSWGLVGNDNTGAGRFTYLEDISLGGSPGYTTGTGGNRVTYKGPTWKRFYNPNLGWEIGEKINVGLDLQLYNSLNFTAEVFKEIRRDIFLSRSSTIPQFLGLGGTTVYANLGKMKNEGVDMSLDYNKQINKDLFVSFKGTFTYAHNTILERDEPPFQEYPNLSSVGHSMGQYLLYIANGLFPDDETIRNNPDQKGLGYSPQPGDIWYHNLPNYRGEYDNVIDGNDRCYVGNPQDPEIVYGFGPSIKYKRWDFSFFFQGAAKTSILISGIHPFGEARIRGLFKYIADDHWSVENPNVNAKYPRLTIENNGNNTQASTYWLRNGSFLKLKNAEIGYTFKGWRFYLSGQNLLTFSPFDYWDPEMGSGSGMKYPTQRVINFGVQVTFNNK